MSAPLDGELGGDGGRWALGDAATAARAAARAYDGRGATLAWWPLAPAPGERFACDVEWRGRGFSEEIARLAPEGMDPFEFWVRCELAAKLGSTPILEWLRRYRRGEAPLSPAGARAWVLQQGEWTLGFGRIEATATEAT